MGYLLLVLCILYKIKLGMHEAIKVAQSIEFILKFRLYKYTVHLTCNFSKQEIARLVHSTKLICFESMAF